MCQGLESLLSLTLELLTIPPNCAILTIANNLGYSSINSRPRVWYSNQTQTFYTKDDKVLMEVKAFKNGNLHIKFNQSFIRKLNVEFGRLKGWLKNKEQASEELNIPIKKVEFNTNFQLNFNNQLLLN